MRAVDKPEQAVAVGSAVGPGEASFQAVFDKARSLGFDAVGVARADLPLEVEHERYRAFVDAGKQGVMRWLAADPEARRTLDGSAILPGARSVVCLARRYARSAEDELEDPEIAKLIARYARGQDYHNHLRKKLRSLAKFIRGLGPGVRARPLCDEEPILERAWAARAGLGFIGKNGLLIIPGQGSFVLLGEVVTTLELPPGTPIAERCGTCTRCLDACPTQAFDAPFVLDPRRCIAYLTIEDPSPPPPHLAPKVGEHLFGCDDCQSVCPFNRTAPGPRDSTRAFRPLDAWRGIDLEHLVTLDEAAFVELTIGSPVRRATRAGLARSVALVAQARVSRGGPDAAPARRVLLRAAAHDDPRVRRVALEALGEHRPRETP